MLPLKAVKAQSHNGKAESSSKGLHVETMARGQSQIPGTPLSLQSKFFNRHNSKPEEQTVFVWIADQFICGGGIPLKGERSSTPET